MKNRVDIKNFILSIEQQFLVNDWTFENTHIWPFIRIKLFLHLTNKLEGKENKIDINKRNYISKTRYNFFYRNFYPQKKRLKKILKGLISIYWIKKLPQKKHLYLSQDNYRVNYKGVRYNRFFDTINDSNNSNESSLIFEEGRKVKLERYNENNVYNFDKKLYDYLEYKKIFSNDKSHKIWKDYDKFIDYLRSESIEESFLKTILYLNLLNWFNNHFRHTQFFFKKCLESIKPEKTFILCYYFDSAMALTSASNLKNIPTYEMQHGPQTSIHLAYGSWSNLPSKGYDIFPRNFLCWNKISMLAINNWAKNSTIYKIENFGNPWVNFWKNKTESYLYKDYVLYSLQPSPFTLEMLFFPELIKTIKKSEKKWFIRLHPRQISDYNSIELFLKKKGLLNLINLHNATFDPLPLLLANAFIHVTNFSGTTLEADFFNLKTILLNETGRDSFNEFILQKKAIYIDNKDLSFKKELLKLINLEDSF